MLLKHKYSLRFFSSETGLINIIWAILSSIREVRECVCEILRESMCMCVCVRERERERERVLTLNCVKSVFAPIKLFLFFPLHRPLRHIRKKIFSYKIKNWHYGTKTYFCHFRGFWTPPAVMLSSRGSVCCLDIEKLLMLRILRLIVFCLKLSSI